MINLPLVELLVNLFRGGIWEFHVERSLVEVLIEKGYVESWDGYCVLTRDGYDVLIDIGAIQK